MMLNGCLLHYMTEKQGKLEICTYDSIIYLYHYFTTHSISIFTQLFKYSYIYLYIYLFVNVFIYLLIYLFIHLFIYIISSHYLFSFIFSTLYFYLWHIRGRLAVSLSIVPKSEVESRPVGTGRDEPNINPFLPPPFGRMSLYVPFVRYIIFIFIFILILNLQYFYFNCILNLFFHFFIIYFFVFITFWIYNFVTIFIALIIIIIVRTIIVIIIIIIFVDFLTYSMLSNFSFFTRSLYFNLFIPLFFIYLFFFFFFFCSKQKHCTNF